MMIWEWEWECENEMIFYEYDNPIKIELSENEEFNSYVFFDQQDPNAMQQQDPNTMQQQDPNGMPLEISPEEQKAVELESMSKYVLIKKLRELKYRLEDNNIYIEELNILMKFINSLSYNTILNLSGKILELSKISRKKNV